MSHARRNLIIATVLLGAGLLAGVRFWRWYWSGLSDAPSQVFNDKLNKLPLPTKPEVRQLLGEPNRITHPRFHNQDECWLYDMGRARNHVCFDERGKMVSTGGRLWGLFEDDVEVEFQNSPAAFDPAGLATLRRIYPKLLPYFENPDDFFVTGMARRGTKLVVEVAGLSQLKAHVVLVNGKQAGGGMLLDDRNVPISFVFDEQLALERCTTNFGRPCPSFAP